jgi:cobalamin biosynthesis Mg chelatase CobN
LLKQLGVPVIQAISTGRSIDEWLGSDQGINNVDITICVAQPELDGVIVGMPVASNRVLFSSCQVVVVAAFLPRLLLQRMMVQVFELHEKFVHFFPG